MSEANQDTIRSLPEGVTLRTPVRMFAILAALLLPLLSAWDVQHTELKLLASWLSGFGLALLFASSAAIWQSPDGAKQTGMTNGQ